MGLEILIDWPVLVDSGDWILLAFALSLYGTVFGFILGLLSGAIVGMTYELFGPKATLATGFIIPLAIAAAILELRFSFDLWDSPGQHPLEFGVLVLATMLALIIIVRQHVRVLQNYAVSAAKIRHTPQLSSHL